MLDYVLQFLLFLGKVVVIGGLLVIILGVLSKVKSKVKEDADDAEKAELVITDYAELLIADRVKLFNAACSKLPKKTLKKLIKQIENPHESKKKEKEAEITECSNQLHKDMPKAEIAASNTELKNTTTDNTAINDASNVESKLEDNQNAKKNVNLNDWNGIHALFILDFDGSTTGHEVKFLRRAVTVLVKVAEAGDEVLLRLKSPGGTVNGYGLCAAELERLRKAGIRLTIAVDEVAASGGYMMACVGSKIIAAPFAYIGSIGVVASLPNFHRVLKKYDVDYEQITAGEYKRTITMLGENTEEGRQKLKDELKAIHEVFMAHVSHYRPLADMKSVGTGEHWLALEAQKLGLVDEIMTSDEYILNNLDNYDRVFKLGYKQANNKQRSLMSFIGGRLAQAGAVLLERLTGVKL